MAHKRIITGAILVIVACTGAAGQQAAPTPFYAPDVGRYYDDGLAYNYSMGGVGIGMPNYLHLNTLNPAGLVFNQFTLLEVGAVGEYRTLSNNTVEEENSGINFSYLTMGFPIKRGRWTTALTLMPHTRTNYRALYFTSVDGGSEDINIDELSQGGITGLQFANGVSLNKHVALGVKLGYFFGSLSRRYAASLNASFSNTQFSAGIDDKDSYSGFGISGGILFHMDSLFRNSDYRINAGLVYSAERSLNTTRKRTFGRINTGNITDTMRLVNETQSSTVLPQSIGIGGSIGKATHWQVGTDFTYTLSSQFRNFDGLSPNAVDSWKWAIGGWIIPEVQATENYLKRITYQMGFNLEQLPYTLAGNEINKWGINIGFSLPIDRISSINIAAGIGKQGNIGKNAVEEIYFELYCGLTFGGQWFVKRRFE